VKASSTIGNQLTIYSGLPLHGPSSAISQQIIDGEKLALAQIHGQIGSFKTPRAPMWD
jgi:hypothetical protein